MAGAGGGDAINLKRLSIDPMDDDDDDDEEFEPLFSYGQTIGPAPTFFSDDSDEEVIISSAPKRRPEIMTAKELSTPTAQTTPPVNKVILDDDDDSWLMDSPPKLLKQSQPAVFTGNHVLQQLLREKRRELTMLQQQSSEGAIRRVEELARMEAQLRPELEHEPLVAVKTPDTLKPHVESPRSEAAASEKEKVLIRVQNKAGSSQSIRMFTTNKFEKLFSVYAGMAQVPLANLSFRFDGDQLSPHSTPKEFDMEDSDIIEVYDKN